MVAVVELPERATSAPPKPAAAAAVDVPDGVSSEQPCVLICDDDPNVVRLLAATLRHEGLRLVVANDGESALRMARAERPALVLLDWRMPGTDGLEVCRALRAEDDPRLRDVPVVLVTAQTGPESTAAGFEAGVTDYLTKPFTPPHVRARVRAWLLRAGAGSAPER